MLTRDLHFEFPNSLIATRPQNPPRVLLNEKNTGPKEISFENLKSFFTADDVLIVNETKVIPSRVRDQNGIDFLFVKSLSTSDWEVLFPAKKFHEGHEFQLPGGLKVTLLKKQIPQIISTSRPLDFEYFEKYGEVNLPPYILEQRREKSVVSEDKSWYQTGWAKNLGSVAAPTASLHFSTRDFDLLKERGVKVATLTLHVGLGTFLPVRSLELKDHKMHFESVEIPKATQQLIADGKSSGKRVWALGTTVARSLEAFGRGDFKNTREDGSVSGQTDIFIYPPYEFRLVDGLLTNFHQPESTLLAMVCAFYGTKQVLDAYGYAIQKNFRLFSYGDLSVWIR